MNVSIANGSLYQRTPDYPTCSVSSIDLFSSVHTHMRARTRTHTHTSKQHVYLRVYALCSNILQSVILLRISRTIGTAVCVQIGQIEMHVVKMGYFADRVCPTEINWVCHLYRAVAYKTNSSKLRGVA